MIKKIPLAGIAAASLCGSAVYVLAVPGTEVMASTSQRAIKGDRLDIRPLATACSEHAWPYYNSACVRDRRRPGGWALEVRILSADRLSLAKSAAHTTR